MSEHVAILGAGLAGLAAAQRARSLGLFTDLYEKNHYVGGHASSHVIDGFTFDEGPHVSFTKNQEIKDLFAAATEYLEHRSVITNYSGGYEIRHPAQTNLFGLPVEVVEKCLVGFVDALQRKDAPPENYEDWCVQGLGREFSEEFTFRYTKKYWTTDPANMSTDWVGTRMYRPQLSEVIRGALAPSSEDHHYLNEFRYPLQGGFGSYVRAVSAGHDAHLGHAVGLIDLASRTIEFTNGKRAHFESLISSLPIPELIRRIKDVPTHVREAAERLVCTSVEVVNVGVARDSGFPDAHWMYYYDEDTIFSRGNFPHRLSPNNVPAGCGSVQVEIYHSRYAPLQCTDVLGRAIDDLIKERVLERSDEVLVAQQQHIAYANVLFDRARLPNLTIVQQYLESQDVIGCGRYGEWAYLWTDDSIVSGWKAAERVAATAAATATIAVAR